MPNALDQRFSGESDVPPGVPTYAMGAVPTRAATPTPSATPSLSDRAKAHFEAALSGLSGLLGRAVTAIQRPVLPPPNPNILATVPQIPSPTPPPPVAPPRGTPEPFALNTWLAQQTSK